VRSSQQPQRSGAVDAVSRSRRVAQRSGSERKQDLAARFGASGSRPVAAAEVRRTDARCEARGNRSAPAQRARWAGHNASPEGAAVKASRISWSPRRQREPACGSCRGARTDAKCEARSDRSAPARRTQRVGHGASPVGAAARAEWTSRSLRRQRKPTCDSYRGSRTGVKCEARGNRSAPARRAQRAGHGASPEGAAVKASRTPRSLRRQWEPACGSCRGSRTGARCDARSNRSAPARRAQRAGHDASPDGAAV
jgi:hypothetical protein